MTTFSTNQLLFLSFRFCQSYFSSPRLCLFKKGKKDLELTWYHVLFPGITKKPLVSRSTVSNHLSHLSQLQSYISLNKTYLHVSVLWLTVFIEFRQDLLGKHLFFSPILQTRLSITLSKSELLLCIILDTSYNQMDVLASFK